MKTVLLFASLSINIVLVFIACSKSGTSGEAGNMARQENGPQNRAVGTAAIEATNAVCVAPPPVMTYASVAQMTTNYRNNQLATINTSMGISDARAACFNLDSIENFICNLRNMSAATGCSLLKNLGIRFYYGAYSNNQPGIAATSYRKHTLIMIPTYKNAQGVYTDFDPSLINVATCTPLPLRTVAPTTPVGNNVIASGMENTNGTGGNGNLFGMNHPGLAPPPNSGLSF